MGRRSQHTPEVLRKLILDAAQEIIEDGGVARLSAREIARKIGYAPGTLYNMYQNLSEIQLKVEASLLKDLDSRLDQEMNGHSGAEAVRRFARSYVGFASERPKLWNLLTEHHLDNGEMPPDWYVEHLRAPCTKLEKPIAELVKSPDKNHASHAARTLWHAVHGMTVLATNTKLSGACTVAPEQVVHLVDVFLSGLEAGVPQATRLGNAGQTEMLDSKVKPLARMRKA